MKPIPGQTVWYYGDIDKHCQTPLPAMVLGVSRDGAVYELSVFIMGGKLIPVKDPPFSETPRAGFWTWKARE